jgi:alkylated DNA nucleotide flippase Atl1
VEILKQIYYTGCTMKTDFAQQSLIPCHRVINKAGQAHHYRWGTARKQAMLGWEASHRAQEE